jgi:succinate dehydrogenase / fumarate reductase iron-sulfur subunit
MSNDQTVVIEVKRQDSKESSSYYQTFELPYEPGMNITSALQATKAYPKTKDGKNTCPVAYESGCLEEVCGSCTMVINGQVRQACTALVDKLPQPIKIEPMSKFPVVRDLVVDRSQMFNALKKVHAWVEIDGVYDLGEGPKVPQKEQERNYALSRCMTCGCCLEVCPQWDNDLNFIGPQAISQAVLFNSHPNGKSTKGDRTKALIDNGLQNCGNAQNCVKACPKEIPLTDSIARANGEATAYTIEHWLMDAH